MVCCPQLLVVITSLWSMSTKFYCTGVVGNLKSTSSLMYRLYLAMKECSPEQFTQEEIAIASGKKVLDPASDFLSKLESTNENIRHAFEKQVEAATVS
jgi:hypothetical protein